MKRLLLLALCGASLHCTAQQIDENRLANAVYLAEGGAKARVPYGILSVSVHSASEARAVCLPHAASTNRSMEGSR
jgi:hypothetical protein